MDSEPGLCDRIRVEVVSLLGRSPVFRELSEDVHAQIVTDMTRVSEFLADGGWLAPPAGAAGASAETLPPVAREGVDALREMVKAIEFPEFVAALVQGVFGAIVDASRQQMQAYVELMAAVSKTVDEFAEHQGNAEDTLLDHKMCEASVVAAAKRELARQRQQQLATMVLMGINRIVVT